MGLRFGAVELRRGREVDRGACAAMSHLPGSADALGWVLALVARAAADRTHLDSTRSLWSLSTHARVATGYAVGATARRRGCHRAWHGAQAHRQRRSAPDRYAA